MTALKKTLPAAIGALLLVSSAHAAVLIDFNGQIGTHDPTVGQVSFFAGNPGAFNDTLVDDSLSFGDGYLVSGWADGTGNSPASGYDTFIGVSKAGDLFGSVTFDIASISHLPGTPFATNLFAEAYLGGSLVGSSSVGIVLNNFDYHSLSLSIANGFDSLRIFDDVNGGFGDEFRIDNFSYSGVQTPPPPPPPPSGVPEPGTLFLLGLGLTGLYLARRKQA